MRSMDLEADVEQFGASDVEQLSWKNLLDGYSCTECGRCTAACPANITGKPLSPRKIVVNTRQRLMEKAPVVTGDRMEFLQSGAAARRGRRCRRDDGRRGARASPARHLHHRGRALGVHELPRVRHGVPGVDRSARRHQPDAPQPGAHRVALSRGAAAGVRVARAQRLAVGVPARRPRRLGARAWTSRRWPSCASAASARTSCSGSAAWARSTTARRRSPSPSRASSRRATSASPSSARRSTATAIRRAAWATSTSTRCWRRTRSRRSTATR